MTLPASSDCIAPVSYSDKERLERLEQAIRTIPDYPKPGIQFKDITTVIREPRLYQEVLDLLQERVAALKPDYVVGIEARGFIFGAPLADRLQAGFVPVRKRGKLPGPVIAQEYTLEYGTDCIEVHEGAIEADKRVLVVDDLLATGGTVGACSQLIQQVGANVSGYLFLIELDFLQGRKRLPEGVPIEALIHY